tara:strand:- start:1152 stop:2036 length:885 start_codon:yes stop_codon:yes gene_type:complete
MSYDTYIINLKQDVEKYQRMEKRLKNIGINYTRFDAYYGKNLDDKYDPLISNYKQFIPKSTIGCGLSHYMVCNNHFKNDKNKIALILEDDAVPLFKDKKIINKIINDAPKDWEIILLYTQGCTNYKDNSWDVTTLSGSTMAYLINYKGFKSRFGDDYIVKTHTDIERCFSKCKTYKTPIMYFKPEFSESLTSTNIDGFSSFYKFLDNLYYNELETDVTGFTGSMGSKYKILRIPCFDVELDTLGIILYLCLIFMIISIILSKNILNTIVDSIVYCCAFIASFFAMIKIYLNIIV